jgi:DNA-binding NarL/FixJ family response regulator
METPGIARRALAAGRPARVDRSASRAAIRVWLVEDNRNYRELLARTLNDVPNIVCVRDFGAAEDALRALAHCRPPAVILLDVELPGLSGLQAAARLKRLAPSTRTIMLTVSDDPQTIAEAISAGAAGYLLKPSPLDKIVESICDVHARGAALAPVAARSLIELFRHAAPSWQQYHFTPREQKVLELMSRGLVLKEIASQLELSFHTVDTHVHNIYAKLDVHTRTAAVVKALRNHFF